MQQLREITRTKMLASVNVSLAFRITYNIMVFAVLVGQYR